MAHYCAAKSAMIGFAKTVSLEGASSNIQCNVIVPTALSRMVSDAVPSEVAAKLESEIDPKDVAQLAVWLCHNSNTENGSMFEVGGGFIAKIRYAHSKGAEI